MRDGESCSAVKEHAPDNGKHLFQDERLLTLLQYWNDRREGNTFPSRKSIDPLDLTSMLSGIWLSDFEPDQGTFRYRLAGEEVSNALGMPVRGRLLSEIVDETAFPKVNTLLRRVIEEPAVLYVSGTVHRNIVQYSKGERLALPIQTDSESPNGILGITLIRSHLISVDEGEDHTPYRRFLSVDEISGLLDP